MLDRRKFLKIVASLSAGKTVEASKVSRTCKKWRSDHRSTLGILKLTIKDGKIVKSEPWEKVTKMDNPLQHYTADMVYKSRLKYPYMRKSYLENPDNPKPELRGKDEFVRVSYDEAIKLIVKELKKQGIVKVQVRFLVEAMAGNQVEICKTHASCFIDF